MDMGIARRIAVTAAAAAMGLSLAAPASALTDTEAGEFVDKLTASYTDPTVSSDGNAYDFDIVTKAALATGAVDTLASLNAFTLFAPNDRAFEVLANDLGLLGKNYRFGASVNETRVFNAIKGAADQGKVNLTDVLLYHVVPNAKVTGSQVLSGPFTQRLTMANEESLRVTVLSRSARFPVIVLGDRDGKLLNDLVYRPDVISTDNTVVHAVSDVLLPPSN